MADALFEDRRLAGLYDVFDDDRSDLAVYSALVDELGAESVLDVGCGTGTFACLLAKQNKRVVAVDPAAASLEVARRKPCADRVHWIEGDATLLPPLQMDLAVMTGNVAPAIVVDSDWSVTLAAIRAAVREDGWLVFETRNPKHQAWLEWTPEKSRRSVDVPSIGVVEAWVEVTAVRLPLVSFRWTFVFKADGTTITSDSTLRFRHQDEVEESLVTAGFAVREVRDAPDRPGKELVFLAR
jgi:SAM-dependent methyltransferase